MGWLVNATPRPLYPRERDSVPIVQETRWASVSVWTCAEILAPHRNKPGIIDQLIVRINLLVNTLPVCFPLTPIVSYI